VASTRGQGSGGTRWWGRFAASPGDGQEARSEKTAVLLVAAGTSVAGVVWALMYLAVFGLSLPLLLAALYVLVGACPGSLPGAATVASRARLGQMGGPRRSAPGPSSPHAGQG
jgi:hypothetical protein